MAGQSCELAVALVLSYSQSTSELDNLLFRQTIIIKKKIGKILQLPQSNMDKFCNPTTKSFLAKLSLVTFKEE